MPPKESAEMKHAVKLAEKMPVPRAAKIAGVNRTALYNKLKKIADKSLQNSGNVAD